ncbi:hypothetical protein EUX98_g4297 [Antrodiella citrinella]|uniref:DUF6534 domain-containing protein n=1 Tax=Antrodiella citrinella TaxID=2447956 RepID=A0A4S4MUB4_9APHY|nr:hypothetical protein EUX98_g4297 [Antrodiella citrinella]
MRVAVLIVCVSSTSPQVLILWLLDTFDVFLNGHILYYYLVVNFFNPFALANPVWSILGVHITGLQNEQQELASLYLHYRYFSIGIIIAITAKAFGATFAGLQALSYLFYIDFAAMIAADITIAFSLCFFLHTSRTGIRKTESLINILIMYTINTGLLTAADSTAGLITFVVMPNNMVYITFYLQLSKLYINAYLATLNARENLRDRSPANEHVSISLSQMSHSHGRSVQFMNSAISESTTINDKQPSPLSITVTTQVDEMLEEDNYRQ